MALKRPSEIFKETTEPQPVQHDPFVNFAMAARDFGYNINGVNEGMLTINEAREQMGLSPIKDGDHIPRMNNAAESVGGSIIRRAQQCPNCGSTLFENKNCLCCGTYCE